MMVKRPSLLIMIYTTTTMGLRVIAAIVLVRIVIAVSIVAAPSTATVVVGAYLVGTASA